MKMYMPLVYLLVAVTGFAQGFRGFPWGTTPQEIIEVEGVRPVDNLENGTCEISYLYFPGGTKTVAGYDAIVTFTFGKKGLFRGEYFVENNELAFYILSVHLKSKYGNPKLSGKTDEGLDFEEWVTRDGTTRIELRIVSGRLIPRLNGEADSDSIKSVRVRYYDEKSWPANRTRKSRDVRPEL